MRRIEFIAPVEAMRGNLSGKQNLVYNDHDNKAFDAPLGRQYAKNYQPRFIGARRASDGRKYFAVKTKTATLISADTKTNMAILGVIGNIYANVISDPSSTAYLVLQAGYERFKAADSTLTFRAFLDEFLRSMLQLGRREASLTIVYNSTMYHIANPFNVNVPSTPTSGEWLELPITSSILVKFWLELAYDDVGHKSPIVFTVGRGLKGIAIDEWDFGRIISPANMLNDFNVLGLEEKQVDTQGFVAIGNEYLQLDDIYVTPGDDVISNGKYILTTEVPS